MSRVKSFFPDFVLLAGLLLLPLLLFYDVTVGGQTMVPADNLYQWQPWASQPIVPHNSLISDLVLENYVWKQFIRQSVAAGELPLWNPYLFGGAPFLATGQNAAFYPFSLFFLVLPLAKAYGWYTVSQLWLAGALAYFLGRALGVSRPGSFIAGLAYQGCGFLLVSAAVFPMMIGAAAWLPLLLACLERVVRVSTAPAGAGKTLPWAALGGLALGCQILAGHIEITYYTLLVMAAFAGWRLVSRLRQQGYRGMRAWGRPAGWLIALVLLGLMLGGIQFIPFFEVGQANFREGSATLAEVRGWAYPYRRVLAFALPNFFGNPAHHTYRDLLSGEQVTFDLNAYEQPNPNGAGSSSWGIKNYVEGGAYLGILPMLLAMVGAWSGGGSGRRSAKWFFGLLILFSLAFIFGTPLYGLLYYGLPGINQLHSPFRWVFPLSLGVAVLAGFGADSLAEGRRSPWWGYLPAGAGLLLLVGVFASRLFYGQLAGLIDQIFRGLAKAPEAFADGQAFYSYLYPQLVLLGLFLLASGWLLWTASRQAIGGWLRLADQLLFRFPAGRNLIWPLLQLGLRLSYQVRWWQVGAAILIGADLLVANWGFHAAADPALLTTRPELVNWLAAQPGPWRLTTFSPHGDKTLNANGAWLYDLQDIRGYDSIIPKQYTDYMAVIEPQNELPFNRVQPLVNWESLNSPLLDLVGVKYIVTLETLTLPKLDLVWQENGVKVYQNLAVAPRAFTLPQTATVLTDEPLAALNNYDPRQFVLVTECDCPNGGVPAGYSPAIIDHYGHNEVTVTATVADPSWLVLNDSYFAGWKAFVRPAGAAPTAEQEVAIYRVNANFRGVLLAESGQWTVRFRYSPLSFKLGGLTTALSAIVLLFAFGVWGWRRFHNPQAPLTNTRSIAKNSLAPTALNLLNRAIDFLFAAFYLRVLGPAGNGSYATAIAIAGWFEIISNFGLNTLIIREVSRDKSQASHYLFNTTLLRLVTVGLGLLPIVAYTAAIRLGSNPLDQPTLMAIGLLMVGMIFSGIGQGFTGLFYAYESAETPAAIATVTTILKVTLGVIVLVMGYSFVALAGVSIVVNVITLFILGYVAFRQFGLSGPWRADWALQRTMFSQSYPLMINHLLATVFFFLDVPLMRQLNGEAAVGWYNSAYKWINAMNVIPSFFTFALFPVISRQVHHSLADARRTFRMAVKLMILLSLPLAAVTTLLAPSLIGLLGGAEFLPHGGLALQIVIWSIPVGWVNSVTNYMLIALGQERVQVRAFLIGVGFNLLANLLLLPLFSYVAASVITILSEMVLLVIFNVYLRQKMGAVGWFELVWRPAGITLLMLVAMFLGGLFHPLLGLLAGLVVYPAGLWQLGTFGQDERHIWQAVVPAGVSGRIARLRRYF